MFKKTLALLMVVMLAIGVGAVSMAETKTCPDCGKPLLNGGGASADCIHTGSISWYCGNCRYQDTEVIPALGHDLVPGGSATADCEHAGYETKICTRCDYEEKTE